MSKERVMGIFTDSHGLLEPTQAVLEDMKKRGITEIYSLGDNIGEGPNPSEVLSLLQEYNIQSIAGNAEEYVTLGLTPFSSYFNTLKKKNYLWTLSNISKEQIEQIKLFPHSIELLIAGKRLALCHFANDVRIDFTEHSTWTYQSNFDFNNTGIRYDNNASRQFDYTNSDEQISEINYMINKYGRNDPQIRGYVSALDDPIFTKKRVSLFDTIIQGHVHWKLCDSSATTKFYTIRAVGMAYRNEPVDKASYIILREHNNDIKIEEILVPYDRERMVSSILNCDNRYSNAKVFTNITSEEVKRHKF